MKRWIGLLIAATSAAGSAAFVPEHLWSWDAIQLALGLDHFDIAIHQPHPPGYLGPMAAAWAFHAFGLPADRAMIAQSVLAAALAAASVFALARRLGTVQDGVVAGLSFAIHPLTLYYAVSGETYPMEALAAVLLVWFGLSVRAGAGLRALALFFFVYGVSGGVRQNLPLFFLPWAVWRLAAGVRADRLGWKGAGVAAAAALAGLLVWFVPLVALAGGPGLLFERFGTQFFRLFAAHYSPLMGASGSAVRHNLDVAWRFLVEALSVSGLAAIGTFVATRGRGLREGRLWAVWLAWLIPPFLWFTLLFVYKAGHLLFLVPVFAILAARAIRYGVSSRRMAAGLAAAVVLGQAALFLAPPAGWTRTVGGRCWPAIEYEETLTRETIAALTDLAAGRPESVLVVTRDARFDFRRAMYYLPEMRVLWLMDRESTGAARTGAEVCEARAHRVRCSTADEFWPSAAWPPEARIEVGPEVRWIAWFADPGTGFLRALERAVPVRLLRHGRLGEVWLSEWGAARDREVRVGPYRFVRTGVSARPEAGIP